MAMDLDPGLMEEFQELSIERNITSFKSAEEIERLTVDEHLSGIERAVYLLSSGQEVQRISVINNLPDLLRDHHDDCMRRVVPKVREVLHVAQAEMQLAACTAFLQILQRQLVPLHNYTQTFLQTILLAIDSRDPDVANAWLETLLDVIDLLPKDVIKRDILSIAIMKGQLSQPVQSRLSCCHILGKIATKFEPFVIKKEILPVVQSLCQDVEYEVRGCMCRQLDPVARGLGLEATKNAILPELVELTKDEESYVRLAGLETVVEILSLLDDDTCTNTIIPLVCKFCQQAIANEDPTLPAVSRQLGKLLHGLAVNLTDEQKHWFVDFYRKLCRVGITKGSKHHEAEHSAPVKTQLPMFMGGEPEEEDQSVECRKNAAFNFPAMVLFIGARNFKSELSSTFSHLCCDPHYLVRKSVAAGFHEVAKMLGSSVHVIQGDFIQVLKDDHVEVLKGLMANLPETLEIFAKGGGASVTEAKITALTSVIPAMLESETVIFTSNNWRLQVTLMENLACLPRCFTSDQIFYKFVPMIFRKLQTARAQPVRQATVYTILLLLRNTKKLEQREEICHKLCNDFSNAPSCYHRSIFIDICWKTMELFSRRFFKDYFFESALDLALDTVPNIRLRLCPLLPKLKAHIKLPSDRNLLQQLESCVRKLLLNEEDRDVNAALQKAVGELDRTQVQMESLTKKAFLEDDLADQKKEEEENHLLELEEKERIAEENKLANKKERTKEGAGKKGESKIPAPRRAATNTVGKDKYGTSPVGSCASTSRNGAMSTPSPTKDMKRTSSFTKSAEKGLPSSMASTSSSRLRAAANRREHSGTTSPRLSQRPSPTSVSPSGRKGSACSASSGSASSLSGSSSGTRRSSTGSDLRKSATTDANSSLRRHTLGTTTSGIPAPTTRRKTMTKS